MLAYPRVSKSISILSLAIAFGSATTHADGPLTDLINHRGSDPAVLKPVVGPSSNEGYGLLTMSATRFAQFFQELGAPLKDPGKLENKYFKVVEYKSEDALPITDFDGADVLYYLTQAHAYYQSLTQATHTADSALEPAEPLTVRIHATEKFNPILKFSKVPHDNDSAYYPFSRPETWFYVRGHHLKNFNLYDFLTSIGLEAIYQDWADLGGATALQLYQDYDAGMDGTRLPTVIVHEAFHIATDTPALIPMVWNGIGAAEDYANYFGSSYFGKPVEAEIHEFAGRFYRRDYHSLKPVKNIVETHYNSMKFVPSLFWQIRDLIGQKNADRLIWGSLTYLNKRFFEQDIPLAVLAALKNATQLGVSVTADQSAKIVDLFKKNEESFFVLDEKLGNVPLPGAAGAIDSAAQRAAFAHALDEAIRNLPGELKELGIVVTDEESETIRQTSRAVSAPSALERIGNWLKKPIFKAGEGVGYVGDALTAGASAPLACGTDFATGLAFNKAYITDGGGAPSSSGKISRGQSFIGAGGGIGATYGAEAALSAIGHGYAGNVMSASFGIQLANQLICSQGSAQILTPEDQAHPSNLQGYCARLAKLMSAIRLDTARACAKAAKEVRKAF